MKTTNKGKLFFFMAIIFAVFTTTINILHKINLPQFPPTPDIIM